MLILSRCLPQLADEYNKTSLSFVLTFQHYEMKKKKNLGLTQHQCIMTNLKKKHSHHGVSVRVCEIEGVCVSN